MLHEIPDIELVEPKTVEDAVYWLGKYGSKSKIIAGGTDLLGLLKDEVKGPKLPYPEVLVDVKGIREMQGIEFNEKEGLRVGAGVTLTDLAESRKVREKFRALSQAASSVATIQIRNMGTVGGNLCQRPWCWYFRNNQFPCFKKGGEKCYAITGEHTYYFSVLGLGTCIMSHPSDLAPPLVAMDASVTVCGAGGRRSIPIGEFFTGPKEVFENVLKPEEVLVDVRIPSRFGDFDGAYLKDRVRKTWDLSLASAAVLLRLSGGICKESRVCLGGLAPYPYRAESAERILTGAPLNEAVAAKAAKAVMEKAKPLRMTKYKVELGETILKRAILNAAGLS